MGTAEVAAAGNGARPAGASAEPVFVLCAGRSGSTLLRFLLDAHPDLSCPPETNVPVLCGQLATVWSLIEGAPLSANRGDEPPEIPEAAIAGVRETMDRMVGSYLARRGKKRYCDKSLGTARFTYLMQRIWPEAKFLCLYRHPMDVIASGMEACPWGLNGYGFEPYIAETPGNAVFALARFWIDNASVILAAEEEYGDRCHRVRYEDLVTGPQAVADQIFDFLGVARVPGIAEACFAAERERFGPADYKIWHTSQITADSVGRGWTIPAGMIAPPALATINELADKLGYVQVDETWGTADMPGDLRVSDGARQADRAPAAADGGAAGPGTGSLIRERLEAGLSRAADEARQWEQCAESFTVAATPPAGVAAAGGEARWLVNLAARTVTTLDGPRAGANGAGTSASSDGSTGSDGESSSESPGSDWDIIGPAEVWEQVILGRANLSVAMRRYQLRYCDMGNAGPIAAEARIAMLADLLGLTSWGQIAGGARDGQDNVRSAAPA